MVVENKGLFGGMVHFSVSEKKEQDVNECQVNSHNCLPTQRCDNTIGSFQCIRFTSCGTGYTLNAETGDCEDDNECQLGSDNCQALGPIWVCRNTPGSFRCERKLCGPKQTLLPSGDCKNAECSVGFESNEQGQCKDINECQLPTTCQRNQRCFNTIGSYRCINLINCGGGYALNTEGTQCVDIDECAQGTHDCGRGQICQNRQGGYLCQCPTGYTTNQLKECVDIDECTRYAGQMHTTYHCLAGIQPTLATVPGGTGLPRLLQNQPWTTCIWTKTLCSREMVFSDATPRTIAGFRISPPSRWTGYLREEMEIRRAELTAAILTGVDTPTRLVLHQPRPLHVTRQGFQPPPKHQHQGILDAVGVKTRRRRLKGPRMDYDTGDYHRRRYHRRFSLTFYVITMELYIDECKDSSGICHQTCINNWGSYRCSCNSGYTLQHDNRSCHDVDECEQFKDRNLCVGICVNQPGSYSCKCPDGYRLGSDGRTCQDEDECLAGNVCDHPDDVCINTRGGYRCNTISCPSNFVKETEHKNRCRRISSICREGDTNCLNTPGSYSFNFITFVSNLAIPPVGQLDLFTMRGPLWSTTTVSFTLDMLDSRAPIGIERATKEHFRLRRTSHNQAVISLIKKITGPQEIELQLTMKMYHSAGLGGSAVARLFIYVSQYEF
uniref:EGF-like domain-containing protein n=1 Tax=Timema cristinae TaxID=61476 RepID=A0A7R9GU60_TIMCR|nr:unnamed protein product [Timema cristinae]